MTRTNLKNLFLPLFMLLGVYTAGAQTQQIRLSDTRITVLEAFHQIERQTRISVAYNSRLFDKYRVVDFPDRSVTLDQAMQAITDGTGFSYDYNGNTIVVTKEKEKNSVPVAAVRISTTTYNANTPDVFDNPPGRRMEKQQRFLPVDTVYNRVVKKSPVRLEHEFTSNMSPMEDYAVNQCRLPRFAVKTNLLYGAATLTPNLAFEVGTGRRTSLELSASYNGWGLSGSLESNKKLVHMIIKPEFRWWTCERFNGHFFGAHALYARYNIGTYEIPLLFEKNYRYDGHAAGVGISYGYSWAVAKRWNIEFGLGAGIVWMKYDRFDCAACDHDGKSFTKTYFGPTDASIGIVFLIK